MKYFKSFLRQSPTAFLILTFLLNTVSIGALFGQFKTKYPDIPIVDVHIHPSGLKDIAGCLKIADTLRMKYGLNLAYFVGLSVLNDPIADVRAAGKNRFLFAVSEMRPHKLFLKTPEEIVDMVHHQGYVGLKFWFGDPRRVIKEGETGITRIDDPAYDKLFSMMERENVTMTSLHIADPNGPFGDRQNWITDPVYYWTQIRAFERVVAKYRYLTIITAHAAWLICQDGQLDYLRYMLTAYPNLYIDLAATFPYMHLLNTENLRDFIIEYQDRILYGSDNSSDRMGAPVIQSLVKKYEFNFSVLESDKMIEGGIFRNQPTQGLNLPREVLEKIYYKNALKLYPGLKELMIINKDIKK